MLFEQIKYFIKMVKIHKFILKLFTTFFALWFYFNYTAHFSIRVQRPPNQIEIKYLGTIEFVAFTVLKI